MQTGIPAQSASNLLTTANPFPSARTNHLNDPTPHLLFYPSCHLPLLSHTLGEQINLPPSFSLKFESTWARRYRCMPSINSSGVALRWTGTYCPESRSSILVGNPSGL